MGSTPAIAEIYRVKIWHSQNWDPAIHTFWMALLQVYAAIALIALMVNIALQRRWTITVLGRVNLPLGHARFSVKCANLSGQDPTGRAPLLAYLQR